VGRLVAVDERGVPLVTFAGTTAPLEARALNAAEIDVEALASGPIDVLLACPGDDRTRPVILGAVSDHLSQSRSAAVPHQAGVHAYVDEKRIVFNAQREILFRCGKASILLRSDGRVIVKGTHLTSRATELNKIRGAAVKIN
jgi:hypothetical protein